MEAQFLLKLWLLTRAIYSYRRFCIGCYFFGYLIVHYYASYLLQTALPADYERLLELREEVLDLDAMPADLSGSETDSTSSPGSGSDLD